MARLVHKSERDRLLAAAGLTEADADLFVLAHAIALHVKSTGIEGVDLTDPADRTALIAAVGVADVNVLTKAVKLATEAGTLVALP